MTPFLAGLLSLVEADTEVALIPPAQTFLANYFGAKNAIARAAAVAKLEGDALQALASEPAELQAQVAPQINTVLQSVLAKAQAIVAAGLSVTPAAPAA